MRSHLQVQTSRLNSLQSTGPRTAAGKAISSQNYILKSGIYAESEIIKGENPADLAALSADYLGRFHPVTPEARALVDILVHSEWTLRRLRRAEAQLWDKFIHDTEGKDDPNSNPLGQAVNHDESKVFARLQRRIDSTQRNYQRALKDLQQLQTDTPGPLEMEVPAEAPLGFAPSSSPAAPEPILPRPIPGSFFPREAPSAWRL